RLRPGDDVVVRDDVAGLVHNKARAERLLRLHCRTEGVEEWILRRHHLRSRRDLDDTGRGLTVDLADRQLTARAEPVADGGRHRNVHVRDLGRLRLAQPDAERDAERDSGADGARAHEGSRTGEELSLSHPGGIAPPRLEAVADPLSDVGSVLRRNVSNGALRTPRLRLFKFDAQSFWAQWTQPCFDRQPPLLSQSGSIVYPPPTVIPRALFIH